MMERILERMKAAMTKDTMPVRPINRRMYMRKPMTANDPISATRRTGRNDYNRDAPAGFAAHG